MRLDSIEIYGFRCFKETLKITFSPALTIIVGPVGSGKSSIISAIELGLYGATYETAIERAVSLDDYINSVSNYFRIILNFSDDKSKYIIERKKLKGKPLKSILYKDNERISKTTAEVNKIIEEIMQMSLDNFVRCILVRHRSLESLAYGSVLRRTMVIDKMLGIDAYRKIARLIPTKKLSELKDSIANRLKEVEEDMKYFNKEDIKRKIENYEKKIKTLSITINKLEKERKNKILRAKNIDKELSKMISEYNEIKNKLKQREKLIKKMEYLSGRKQQMKKDLEKIKLTQEEILENITFNLENIKVELSSILASLLLGEELKKIEAVKITENNILEVLSVFENIVLKIESKSALLESELAKLIRQKNKLELTKEARQARLSEIMAELEDLKYIEEELTEITAKIKDINEARNYLKKLENELTIIDKMLEEDNCKLVLLKKLLSQLKQNISIKCPICNRDISFNSKKHIEDHLNNIVQGKSKLFLKREKLISEIEEYRSLVSKYEDLSEKINYLEELRILKEYLENEIESIEDRISEIEREAEELEDRLNDIKSFIDKFHRQILKIREQLDYLEKYSELAKINNEIELIKEELNELNVELKNKNIESIVSERIKLINEKKTLNHRIIELDKLIKKYMDELEYYNKEISDSKRQLNIAIKLEEEYSKLQEKFEKIDKLLNKFEIVKESYKKAQDKIRRESILKILSSLNAIFRKIYVHPDIAEIGMKSVKIGKKGAYKYMFFVRRNDGTIVPSLHLLSDGQKIIFAFSLVFTLNRLASHKADFIIFDDPLPNIDDEIRRALAKMIGKDGFPKQVIITTQSDEYALFLKEIAQECKIPCKVYRLIYSTGGSILLKEESSDR